MERKRACGPSARAPRRVPECSRFLPAAGEPANLKVWDVQVTGFENSERALFLLAAYEISLASRLETCPG